MAGTAGGAEWTIPDPVLPIDDSGARAAIGRVAGRAVDLVGGVEDVEIAVPGSEWTFRTATCHLITVFRAFGASLEGRLDGWDTPEGQEVARGLIEVEGSDDARVLARHLDEAARRFVAAPPTTRPMTSWPRPGTGGTRPTSSGP